jgi:chromosome segregation ATPase
MTHENNNINELVSDRIELAAEVEALTSQQSPSSTYQDAGTESDARTFDITNFADLDAQRSVAISELKSDLRSRSETISRLQFDIQQLRSKWRGLETEIKVREEIAADLNTELENMRSALRRKSKLVQERDQSIKSLKIKIRQRDADYRVIKASNENLQKRFTEKLKSPQKPLRKRGTSSLGEADAARRDLAEQAGKLSSRDRLIAELREQLQRTESYADGIRRQLHDHIRSVEELQNSRDALQLSLTQAGERITHMLQVAEEQQTTNVELRDQLRVSGDARANEIRMLRFELGEAQETVAQHELVAEQLALDLVDSRGFKLELERMLSVNEEHNHTQIEDLEKRVATLQVSLAEYEQKLTAKSDAINCLLAELADRSPQTDSIGQIEDVIHNVDYRMTERIDSPSNSDRDRISRVLIGSIDNQELRFPLFKDRVTIGRTRQNDIQLKADYVSRRHAVIVTEGNATRVIDWGSRNGVYVNAHRITEHFLRAGDVVTIGTANFRYEERQKRDV